MAATQGVDVGLVGYSNLDAEAADMAQWNVFVLTRVLIERSALAVGAGATCTQESQALQALAGPASCLQRSSMRAGQPSEVAQPAWWAFSH